MNFFKNRKPLFAAVICLLITSLMPSAFAAENLENVHQITLSGDTFPPGSPTPPYLSDKPFYGVFAEGSVYEMGWRRKDARDIVKSLMALSADDPRLSKLDRENPVFAFVEERPLSEMVGYLNRYRGVGPGFLAEAEYRFSFSINKRILKDCSLPPEQCVAHLPKLPASGVKVMITCDLKGKYRDGNDFVRTVYQDHFYVTRTTGTDPIAEKTVPYEELFQEAYPLFEAGLLVPEIGLGCNVTQQKQDGKYLLGFRGHMGIPKLEMISAKRETTFPRKRGSMRMAEYPARGLKFWRTDKLILSLPLGGIVVNDITAFSLGLRDMIVNTFNTRR